MLLLSCRLLTFPSLFVHTLCPNSLTLHVRRRVWWGWKKWWCTLSSVWGSVHGAACLHGPGKKATGEAHSALWSFPLEAPCVWLHSCSNREQSPNPASIKSYCSFFSVCVRNCLLSLSISTHPVILLHIESWLQIDWGDFLCTTNNSWSSLRSCLRIDGDRRQNNKNVVE